VLPHVPRGGRLLDFGGGDGATAAAIKAEGIADQVGVADLVAANARAALDFSYRGDLTDADLIVRIGREQGPFDTILCLDILEHLVDPWAVVARLHAILRPGGRIVASLPNVRHYSAVGPLALAGRWQYADAGILDRTHLRFFVEGSSVALMTSSGLTVESVVAQPPGRRRDRILKRASLGLLTPFLTQQYVVRVRNDVGG
jgi:SAM-dependent methyltransferase